MYAIEQTDADYQDCGRQVCFFPVQELRTARLFTTDTADRDDLRLVTDAESTPLLSTDEDRRGDVVHDFASVAAVGLNEERPVVVAASLADWIVKNAFAAGKQHVFLDVSCGFSREFLVVGGKVTVSIYCSGINEFGVLLQYGFLNDGK